MNSLLFLGNVYVHMDGYCNLHGKIFYFIYSIENKINQPSGDVLRAIGKKKKKKTQFWKMHEIFIWIDSTVHII